MVPVEPMVFARCMVIVFTMWSMMPGSASMPQLAEIQRDLVGGAFRGGAALAVVPRPHDPGHGVVGVGGRPLGCEHCPDHLAKLRLELLGGVARRARDLPQALLSVGRLQRKNIDDGNVCRHLPILFFGNVIPPGTAPTIDLSAP